MSSAMIPTLPFKIKPQAGLSLVELMVALAISLFLVLGISYVYLGSKDVYRTEESLARMQENGRLAFEYLTRDLRMAGYFGCATGGMTYVTAPEHDNCPASGPTPQLICTLGGTGCADYDFDPSKAVYGYEFDSGTTWSPALPLSLSGVANGTDVVVIRGTAPTSVSIVHDPTPNNASLKVNTTTGIAEGDILMASDCQSSVVFQACQVTNGLVVTHDKGNNNGCALPRYGNNCKDWGKTFTGGTLLKMVRNTYYIKDDSGVPTLYRRNFAGTDEALVPYVENMQIKYGVAPTVDDYPDDYYTAKQVDDSNKWDRVKSIRVELLIRSPDDRITTDKQRIFFNGADVTPTDNRLRLVMSSTIGVRNRIILSTK